MNKSLEELGWKLDPVVVDKYVSFAKDKDFIVLYANGDVHTFENKEVLK